MVSSNCKCYNLVLLRHGLSQWNEKDLFTGWVDIELSKKGKEEAVRAGQLLNKQCIKPDIVYTSLLKRSIMTANIILSNLDRLWIPLIKTIDLNERHYGNLQGKNKNSILKKYGFEKVNQWRRSYLTRPPKIEKNKFTQIDDEKYKFSGYNVPKSESLQDVYNRVIPYFKNTIFKDIKNSKIVMIVAHGNSLRALIKYIDKISDKDIQYLNIETAKPIVYSIKVDNRELKFSNNNNIKHMYL